MNLPQIDLGKVSTLGTLLLGSLLVLAGLAGATVVAGGPTWFLGVVSIMLGLDFAAILGGVVWSVVARQPHTMLATAEMHMVLLERQFEGFQGDTLQLPAGDQARPEPGTLDSDRDYIYTQTRGLFLTHAWRSSSKPRQVADIVIRLEQHLDTPEREDLLEAGKIESVTYELGRKFSPDPIVQNDPTDNFKLEVSAYGPMLCLAEVSFNDDKNPIRLQRYIDFPTAEEMREVGFF
jgi:hypothetical protein